MRNAEWQKKTDNNTRSDGAGLKHKPDDNGLIDDGCLCLGSENHLVIEIMQHGVEKPVVNETTPLLDGREGQKSANPQEHGEPESLASDSKVKTVEDETLSMVDT